MGLRAASELRVRHRYWLECIRLRVDVDFIYNQIAVRDGKGHKDRVTMLPQQVKAPLQRHLHNIHKLHAQALQTGVGHVYLPYALERKYPNASHEWVGNMSSLLHSRRGTHGRVSSGDITSTNWSCSGRCKALFGRQRSPKRRVVIRCATRLRPISSKRGTTFGRCRNYSGTKTSGRR
jgi:hypothetical protein